ncbi:FtsX-like permease family protein [bacterium]|nr:MAG: FtsX-like permease family protein [bacterium]
MSLMSLATVAWRALQQNAMRSLLTMLGVIIGVAAVITSMAIGTGARAAVSAQLQRLGSNLIIVVPGNATSNGVSLGLGARQSLKLNDATAIGREVPAVAGVAPQANTNAQVVSGNQNWSTSIVGTTPAWLRVQNWAVAQGRFFTGQEVTNAAKVCVLGQTVEQNLFPNGDAAGSTVVIKNVPFQVVGILESKGQSGFGRDQDDQVIVPVTSMQLRLTGQNWLGSISISAQSPDAVDAVISSTQALLRLRHHVLARAPNDFQVRNIANVLEAANATSQIQTLLLDAVAAVSLIVGGIGIMNIMLVSVTERTREIGIRMAVGAKERHIMLQFLVEAVALALAGGIIGIVLGVGASLLTSRVAGWDVIVSTPSIVLAFGFSALIGIVFGFYPARSASLLNPIEALRHE